MDMYRLISYPITQDGPTWPGNPTMSLTPKTQISKGNLANTCTIHLFNHYGTHFDAPRHFNEAGLPIAELPLEQFLYQAPLLLEIPKGALEKVEPADLEPFAAQIAACDLLLLRTGFQKARESDRDSYESKGPAVSSRTAKYLLDHYRNLKAIALDFVSLACYADQEDGDLAHQYMLGKFHDHFICIIEDVNMAGLPAGKFKSAAAVPLMIQGVDSCPVTMWVEL